MAVYRDAYLLLGGTNVSAYLQSLEFPISLEALDDTAMGDTNRSNAAGLRNWTITCNFHQSFVNAELDSILWTLFNAGAAFALEVRPTSSAVSTSNPKWTGNGLLTEYTPMTGSVGDQLVVPVTIVAAGPITRATA